MPRILEVHRQRHLDAMPGAYTMRGANARLVVELPLGILPEILIQAEIILPGDRTHEGVLVQGVTVIWDEIIRHLAQDPEFLFKIHWRKLAQTQQVCHQGQ